MDLLRSDLEFILQQIQIAEQHVAAINANTNPALTSADLLLEILAGDTQSPLGLRAVDGSLNNLVRTTAGASDQAFPRLTAPATPGVPPTSSPATPLELPASQSPRLISNLIADQTAANPAAVLAAQQAGGGPALWQGVTVNGTRYTNINDPALQGTTVIPEPGMDGILRDTINGQLVNTNGQLVDEAGNVILEVLNPPVLGEQLNSWFTLFGQFFDHGLDHVAKGGNGTVLIPVAPDDPLWNPTRQAMRLTRATPAAPGSLNQINTITPFVDLSQNYGSDPSLHVFLRKYTFDASGRTVATGELLSNAAGGLPTWDDIQASARTYLGIDLTDAWFGNSPILQVDPYGNFVPDTDGKAIVMKVSTIAPNVVVPAGAAERAANGGLVNLGTPTNTADSAATTGQAFLLDINPAAVNPATGAVTNAALLGQHFIAGDGRTNENAGLTAAHTIFHNEHDRLINQYKTLLINDARASNDFTFINQWLAPTSAISTVDQLGTLLVPGAEHLWNGTRLFQAGRFLTEMQYQHGAFEEFTRLLQPGVPAFNELAQVSIDPTVSAEFAHAVYRFGHSLLNESVGRLTPTFADQSTSLISAFLNPGGFTRNGVLTAAAATGEVVSGMTRQVANNTDEFVTGALRNNLVGQPIDLAALNIARGIETNLPTLNNARRDFSGQGVPLPAYTRWGELTVDGTNLVAVADPNSFAANLRNPLSLVNFIAAYGNHPLLQQATTAAAKREIAQALVAGLGTQTERVVTDGATTITLNAANTADRLEFLRGQGQYASIVQPGQPGQLGGLDAVHLWIGGLAEKPNPNPLMGDHLGSTFAVVFNKTLADLQNGDRFYYLRRLQGNLLGQIEANTFSAMAIRNSTGLSHLPGNIFTAKTWYLEAEANPALRNQFNPALADPAADPIGVSRIPASVGIDGNPLLAPVNTLRFFGLDNVVLGGTDQADLLQGGDGLNTFWGGGGDDTIITGLDADEVFAGAGHDLVIDQDPITGDVMRLEDGNDIAIVSSGLSIVHAGNGNDWIIGRIDQAAPAGGEVFADAGNDFIQYGVGLAVMGGVGDDWLEGSATGANMAGESGAPFLVDPVTLLPLRAGQEVGHDILVAVDGPVTSLGDLGDDIHMDGSGADAFDGSGGFDWFSAQRRSAVLGGHEVWLTNGAPGVVPPLTVTDRFDQHVEGVAGSNADDVLVGDDRREILLPVTQTVAPALAPTNTLLAQDGFDDRMDVVTATGLINGLSSVLPTAALSTDELGRTVFDAGNIILGGGGSDELKGLGGNDILDGDLTLRVQLAVGDRRFDSMSQLEDAVKNRVVNPGQVTTVRELIRTDSVQSNPNQRDVAIFRGAPSEYQIEGMIFRNGTFELAPLGDPNAFNPISDGFLRIQHVAPLLPAAVDDGTDYIRNVEQLVFLNNDAGDGLVAPTTIDLAAQLVPVAEYQSDLLTLPLTVEQATVPLAITPAQEILTDLRDAVPPTPPLADPNALNTIIDGLTAPAPVQPPVTVDPSVPPVNPGPPTGGTAPSPSRALVQTPAAPVAPAPAPVVEPQIQLAEFNIEQDGQVGSFRDGTGYGAQWMDASKEPVRFAIGGKLKGYQVLGTEEQGEGYVSVLRKGRKYAVGQFGESGELISSKSVKETKLSKFETRFEQDFNGDGVVGRGAALKSAAQLQAGDVLVGEAGRQMYALANQRGDLYASAGDADALSIQNFRTGADGDVLIASAGSEYSLGMVGDSAAIYKVGADSQRDLVAVLEGVQPTNGLHVNFSFV